MTALEQAFNSLLFLLCQEIAKKEVQLNKLQAALDASFTREQHKEVIANELRAQDEVHMLRRKVGDLEKQLEEALKATSKRRPRQRLVPTGGRRTRSA